MSWAKQLADMHGMHGVHYKYNRSTLKRKSFYSALIKHLAVFQLRGHTLFRVPAALDLFLSLLGLLVDDHHLLLELGLSQ